jgi:hypothetical protein
MVMERETVKGMLVAKEKEEKEVKVAEEVQIRKVSE